MALASFLLGTLLGTAAAAADRRVRILFVGDIMLDGGPGHIVTNGGDPFAQVATVLADADVTVGNLECAIVKQGEQADKSYTFRGPRAALPLLRRYFSTTSRTTLRCGEAGWPG